MIFTTACNDNSQTESNKKDLKGAATDIINIINNDNQADSVENGYVVYDNYIIDNYHHSYDISDYDIKDGLVYRDKSGKIYATLENDNSCAIKDFNDNDFTIYNISEKDKCHKFYLLGTDIYLTVIPVDIQTNEVYTPGLISDNYISLLIQENVIDDGAIKYKWYRNDEEISNSNVSLYTIANDVEDADYYVEIIANNGESYKSEPINVKINRK